jgi:hypothetical protein
VEGCLKEKTCFVVAATAAAEMTERLDHVAAREEEEEEEEESSFIDKRASDDADTTASPAAAAASPPPPPPQTGLASWVADANTCVITKRNCILMYISILTLLMTCVGYFEPLARHLNIDVTNMTAVQVFKHFMHLVNQTNGGFDNIETEG